MVNNLRNGDVGETQNNKKKNGKEVFVIRRSIFLIFIFFSMIVMLVNLIILVIGLCFRRLINIIQEGAKPPALMNIAIMAEAGSTISQDDMAQAQNDLLIARAFTQSILKEKHQADLKRGNPWRRLEDETQAQDSSDDIVFDLDEQLLDENIWDQVQSIVDATNNPPSLDEPADSDDSKVDQPETTVDTKKESPNDAQAENENSSNQTKDFQEQNQEDVDLEDPVKVNNDSEAPNGDQNIQDETGINERQNDESSNTQTQETPDQEVKDEVESTEVSADEVQDEISTPDVPQEVVGQDEKASPEEVPIDDGLNKNDSQEINFDEMQEEASLTEEVQDESNPQENLTQDQHFFTGFPDDAQNEAGSTQDPNEAQNQTETAADSIDESQNDTPSIIVPEDEAQDQINTPNIPNEDEKVQDEDIFQVTPSDEAQDQDDFSEIPTDISQDETNSIEDPIAEPVQDVEDTTQPFDNENQNDGFDKEEQPDTNADQDFEEETDDSQDTSDDKQPSEESNGQNSLTELTDKEDTSTEIENEQVEDSQNEKKDESLIDETAEISDDQVDDADPSEPQGEEIQDEQDDSDMPIDENELENKEDDVPSEQDLQQDEDDSGSEEIQDPIVAEEDVEPSQRYGGFSNGAIPTYEMDPLFVSTTDMHLYYTNRSHTSMDDWTEAQKIDYHICQNILFVTKDLLSYDYKNFPKLRGYIGFESGGFCEIPAAYDTTFYDKREEYKCEEDTSGNFNHKCRKWYQLQKESPDESVLSDQYRDAGNAELLSTICVSLKHPETNEFYGAMCEDIDMMNDHFTSNTNSNEDQQKNGLKPSILQLDNPLALSHLEQSMLRAELLDWKLEESFDAIFYGNMEINKGSFEVTKNTNELDYQQLDEDEIYGIIAEDDGPTKKFFFIYSKMNFQYWDNFVPKQYQFLVFRNFKDLENITKMTDHLFMTVFRFWMPYFIGASILYLVICAFVIDYISVNMTKPFLELSQKIRMNVKNIQKRKKWSKSEIRLGQRNNNNIYTEMQVDLLKGYQKRNKETNELFINFNSMARILFVGHASTQSDFSYQAFFDLQATAELMLQQRNLRGAGTCYMIIGTKLATQSDEDYNRAMQYLNRSEQFQQSVIEQNQNNGLYNKTTQDLMNSKMAEDQYILAFRQYTRAIISFNLFVKMDEESHNKYYGHEDKRLNYMRQYDKIGLQALTDLEKCLESWPNQCEQAMLIHQMSQVLSKGMQSQNSNLKELRKISIKKENIDDQYVLNSQKDTPSNFRTSNNGITQYQPDVNLASVQLADIEMGRLIKQGEQFVIPEVLERDDFEQHCDEFLLGSNKSDGSEPSGQKLKIPIRSNDFKLNEIFQKEQSQGHSLSFFSSSSSSSYDEEQYDEEQLSMSSYAQDDSMSRQDEQDISGSEFASSRSAGEIFTANLRPARTIGGTKHGQIVDQAPLNGFEDLHLYIKQLIIEVKILLMPIYQYILRGQNEHMESDLGAGGNSEYMSSREMESLEKDSNQSRSYSVNGSEDKKDLSDWIKIKLVDGGQEDELFKDKQQSEKLQLYARSFHIKKDVKANDLDELDQLEQDIQNLGRKVNEYSPRRLQAVKRMGLTKIKSDNLQQNQHYLVGLHKFTMRKKGSNYSEATRHFIKSVCCSKYQINALSRKSLIKLHTILMKLYEKKITELSRVNCSIARYMKQQEQILPKSISRRIDRQISYKEKSLSRNIEMKRSKSSNEQGGGSSDLILLGFSKIDDSVSIMSPTPHNNNDQQQYIQSCLKESTPNMAETQRVEDLQQSVKRLEDNIHWVKIRMSHHLVNRRSICFVLDTDFSHVKQEQLCKELIIETFRELDAEDYFGLYIHEENEKKDKLSKMSLHIPLEEKGNNLRIKEKILHELNLQENEHFVRQGNNYMKQMLNVAVQASVQLPVKKIIFQELLFDSPIKWVVAFIGNMKGLLNMGLLNMMQLYEENPNILIVFVTDEQPDIKTITEMQETIGKVCAQGGIMILRYRETLNYQSKHKNRDQIAKAFQRIKSTIALFPSKNIPIIQEELAL